MFIITLISHCTSATTMCIINLHNVTIICVYILVIKQIEVLINQEKLYENTVVAHAESQRTKKKESKKFPWYLLFGFLEFFSTDFGEFSSNYKCPFCYVMYILCIEFCMACKLRGNRIGKQWNVMQIFQTVKKKKNSVIICQKESLWTKQQLVFSWSIFI